MTINDRDKRIIELASEGKTPDVIGEAVGLGPTRVRQILSANVPDLRSVKSERLLSQVKDDVQREYAALAGTIEEMCAGKRPVAELPSPYANIVSRYGKKRVQDLNAIGYNLFRYCQEQRDSRIAELAAGKGMSGSDLATMFAITRDHVYGILHDRGVRKIVRLRGKKKAERDMNVYKRYLEVGKYGPVAKEFNISQVLVGLIVNAEKRKLEEK